MGMCFVANHGHGYPGWRGAGQACMAPPRGTHPCAQPQDSPHSPWPSQYSTLLPTQHGRVGHSGAAWHLGAPCPGHGPQPQTPRHVGHVPVLSSLWVSYFPARTMHSLTEANQYAPGPLSYKMPTYLKRGWGVRTFRADPAPLQWMAKLPLIFRCKELARALKYSQPRNNSNKQKK